jgi:hypothetical protein
MTFEEMKEIANEVVAALRAAGFGSPELLESDLTPGEPLPIAFVSKGGDELVLALDVL